MKQAALDPLYQDNPKECTALCLNLQMLMLKARHGWSDTSFNELLSILATTYPTPAGLMPTLTTISCRGTEYEKLMSCPHCGTSRYKRNASCHVDVDDDGALRGGPKKKKGAKKSGAAKQILAQQDEEEEGYTQRKSPALPLWYLPVIDRLRAIFGNTEDDQLMSWHASDGRLKDDGKLWHPSDGK